MLFRDFEMSKHRWDFVRHWQILVGQCPMTDCYLQPRTAFNILSHEVNFVTSHPTPTSLSDCLRLATMISTLADDGASSDCADAERRTLSRQLVILVAVSTISALKGSSSSLKALNINFIAESVRLIVIPFKIREMFR